MTPFQEYAITVGIPAVQEYARTHKLSVPTREQLLPVMEKICDDLKADGVPDEWFLNPAWRVAISNNQ